MLKDQNKLKDTPASEAPIDWEYHSLGTLLSDLESGVSVSAEGRQANKDEFGVLKVSAVSDGKFIPSQNKAILPCELSRAKTKPKVGSILLSRSNTPDLVGESALIKNSPDNLFLPDKLWQFQSKDETTLKTTWLSHFLQLEKTRKAITSKASGTSRSMRNISKASFLSLRITLPPLPEQKKIAEILSTWDEALEKLDALISAKQQRKKALMQRLLTGKKRLPGYDKSGDEKHSDKFGSYPADWTHVALGDITEIVNTKNTAHNSIPVLSCTKHHGLVLSEEYFGKRIYADNTSGYRIVKRNHFAYATNHIEEGSIGYQNICDTGLVSPIYTVFKTTSMADDSYLFRVLKSPLLIHQYQTNTNASVNRRGSLRYKEFSKIKIWLPSIKEQQAIAEILNTCDEELALLKKQRDSINTQKRGLMQRLLTGKIRTNEQSK